MTRADDDERRHGARRVALTMHSVRWHVDEVPLRRVDDGPTPGAEFHNVKESLLASVPMVVLPITADQPYCAQRCVALGVGRVVAPDARDASTVRAAASAVLADSTYRVRARGVSEEMCKLPVPDTAVSLLGDLTARSSHREQSVAATA